MSSISFDLDVEQVTDEDYQKYFVYLFFIVFLRVCCREHDELMRQVEDCVFEQERKELRRVQERLLLKMERKGEQISKLYKHKSQVCFHICSH